MPETRRPRRAATLGVVACISLGAALPALAQPPDELSAVIGPIRFEPPGSGTTFTLGDGRRYGGALEVRRAPDGDLVLVNDVPMRTYLEGLGEMPPEWPAEALRAQAVAARTYAWHQLRLGTYERRGLGYDICDSVACQVYRGRDVVEQPFGERWADAVADTAGEVLLHDGAPILARYFSTSGGHTRNNEHVYPSEGPRPYLKGVPDPDDEVSPLHRWEVTFTRAQLDAILGRGERLGAVVPIADIEHLTSPGGGQDQVRVTGRDGTVVSVGASSFRSFVSSVAPELFPEDFPAPWPGRMRRYPATLLSSRLSFTVTEDHVVVEGRGWGHGVGMGQYGARGKADRGLTYDQILHAYYRDVELAAPAEVPDRVRVGIGRGGDPVRIRADRPVRIVAGGQVLVGRALGTWSVQAGPDGTYRLVPPDGYGTPLGAHATSPSRASPLQVESIRVTTTVDKTVELRLQVRDAAGATMVDRFHAVVGPGRHTVAWDLDDDDGQPLPPGRYAVALAAVDETGAPAAEPADVEVRRVAPADPVLTSLLGPVSPPDGLLSSLWPPVVAGVVAGTVAGGVVRRRGPAADRDAG